MLISEDFVYYGGYGPQIPVDLADANGRPVCKQGIGRNVFDDPNLVVEFEHWIRSLGETGYQNAPYEWRQLRGSTRY
ncbi:hypothetical protein [Kitasatospora cinereorecta]|uniref:Nucleotide modification associated domain-containing protein n=1 Tax=Kitasatospora cinereorecta TaxID=285560 RepID=A0ABW0VRW3_9ACTN